jgi:hypothetical protein
MIHYEDVIPELELNVKHRNAELTKPLLRLFSSCNDAPIALEKIRHALSKFITGRNELKRNSIESKLLEAIDSLIERHQGNPDSDESKELGPYAFYNQDIWAEVKEAINGEEIPFKSESVYTIEYGRFRINMLHLLIKVQCNGHFLMDSDEFWQLFLSDDHRSLSQIGSTPLPSISTFFHNAITLVL